MYITKTLVFFFIRIYYYRGSFTFFGLNDMKCKIPKCRKGKKKNNKKINKDVDNNSNFAGKEMSR